MQTHLAAHRAIFVAVLFVFIGVFASACSLIWEDADTAANRLMKATENRDRRAIGEFFEEEGTELEMQLRTLSAIFDGPQYEGFGQAWTIDGIEKDESDGLTYVWVIIEIPAPQRSSYSSAREEEIVIALERPILAWYVRDIEGLEDILDILERQRKER